MFMHQSSPLGKLRIAVVICCLFLILGILGCAYLSDRNNSVLDKNEITSNVETLDDEDLNYSYLSSYVKKYGIGNVNAYKINEAETKLRNNFYKSIPDNDVLSRKVVSLFVENYYDTVDLNDKTAVTDAVLTCLIHSIEDPWAFYRTAKQYADYSDSLESGDDFVGIGIQINQQTLKISMVFKDSGAEAAGIKPGDVLYGVNDKTSEDTSFDELLDMIKGEPDTTVKITVKRGDDLLDFNVVRKLLTERTVYYELDENKLGYVQITQFLGTTFEEFKEAIDYLTENDAIALVIDVRYNPGGLLNSVAAVIDYLVPDEPQRRIGSYTQNGQELVFTTIDGHGVDLPIAVICNEFTASAGELFTAAMRDYGNDGILNTVIIGNTTYGKGVAQSSFHLYDGSAITFTIGYFNPPCNENFDGIGVIPDVPVTENATYDAPLKIAKEHAINLANSNTDAEELLLYAA